MKACGLGTDTIFAEAISRRSSLVPLPTSEMSPGDAAQGVLLQSALASQENVFGEFRERANKSPTFNVMGSSEDEVAPTPAKARRGRRSSHEGAKSKAANPKEISESVSAPAMRNSARGSRRSREVVVSKPRPGSAADNVMEASVTTQTAAEPASSVESLERPPPVRPRPSWLEKPAMAVGAAPLQNDVFDSELTGTNDTPCSIRAALSTMMPESYHGGERIRVSSSPSCSDESVKEPPLWSPASMMIIRKRNFSNQCPKGTIRRAKHWRQRRRNRRNRRRQRWRRKRHDRRSQWWQLVGKRADEHRRWLARLELQECTGSCSLGVCVIRCTAASF